MREFPEASYVEETCIIRLNWPHGNSSIHGPDDLVKLYNELRTAYLKSVPRISELEDQVRQLELMVQESVPRDDTSDEIKSLFDPRLPGDRRVPMEPGLYLARCKEIAEWCYIVAIEGAPPYLQVQGWRLDSVERQLEPSWSLGRGDLFYGPRLAGPDWRKITDEHLHRVPEADAGQ